ncbi:hypothetical protein ACFLXY_01490 [Chloroflexota bacterium]
MSKQVKPRRSFIELLKYIADLLIDPVLFGYLLLVTFQRIQSLTNGNKGIFWERLGSDIENNMGDYWIFIILFVVWVFYRSYRMREDKNKHDEIIGYLKDISENTKKIK